MRDLLLQAAGCGAMLVAVLHAVLGERKLFARAVIEPRSVRRMLRLGWHCGAVAWACFGLLLVVTPMSEGMDLRRWIIAAAAMTFAFGVVGNAWCTRGRHFGWVALTAVIALAIAGL